MTEKQYPPLPEPFGWLSYNVLTRKTFFGNTPRQSLQPGVYQHIRAYSQSQVIAAIDADRAMRAAKDVAVAGPIGLDHCPITGRKFWGNIEHPELGLVATYGGPFDTYTIPAISDDGELRCERFDQDAGHWIEGGEPAGWFFDEQPDSSLAAKPQEAVPTKMPIPPSLADPLDVVYAEGWNAACDAFFGGKPPPDPLAVTVTQTAPSQDAEDAARDQQEGK